MKCKECGFIPQSKPRFCPQCGSYFIDSDDPHADIVWKGVKILVPDPDIDIIDDRPGLDSDRSGKKKKHKVPKVRKGWGITALSCSGITFLITLLVDLVPFYDFLFLFSGPLYIFSIVAAALGRSHLTGKLAAILLILSTICFFSII